MPTTLSNTLLFLLKNVRIFCLVKDSHIFPTKNNIVFVIFTFEILTTSLISNNGPQVTKMAHAALYQGCYVDVIIHRGDLESIKYLLKKMFSIHE